MTATAEISATDQRWCQMMAAAQRGDGRSYGALLGELLPFLCSLARRHLRAPEEVEDSVQDIVLTIHSVRHTFDPTRPLKPWVATIARRWVADRLQRLGQRGAREVLLLDDETFFALAPNHGGEAAVRVREVIAAVDELPRGQRDAV